MIEIIKKIQEIFDKSGDQGEALLRLYMLFIPEFESVVSIGLWPECGKMLHQFIFERFIAFDCIHHPEVMPGGLWLNKGFTLDEKLMNWEVNLDNCGIMYQERQKCPA